MPGTRHAKKKIRQLKLEIKTNKIRITTAKASP